MIEVTNYCNIKFFKRTCQFLIYLIILKSHAIAEDSNHKISYKWLPQFYGKIKGENKLLFSRSFSRSQLRFVDIDNDGDKELFIGKEDGRIAFFEKQGPTNTQFELITEDFFGKKLTQLEETIGKSYLWNSSSKYPKYFLQKVTKMIHLNLHT